MSKLPSLLPTIALLLLSATQTHATQDIQCSPNLVNQDIGGTYKITPFSGPPSDPTVSTDWTIYSDIYANGSVIDQVFSIDTNTDRHIINNASLPYSACAIAIESLPLQFNQTYELHGECLSYVDSVCVNDIVFTATQEIRERIENGTWQGKCREALPAVPDSCRQYVAANETKWTTSESADLFTLPHSQTNAKYCSASRGNGNAFLELVQGSSALNSTARRVMPIVIAAWSKKLNETNTANTWVQSQLLCIGSNTHNRFNTSGSVSTRPWMVSLPLTGMLIIMGILAAGLV